MVARVRDRLSEQLVAELRKLVPANGKIRQIRERPWASITFSGTRFLFEVSSPTQLQNQQSPLTNVLLAEHEFQLEGYFVADARLKPTAPDHDQHQRVEILVIADPV